MESAYTALVVRLATEMGATVELEPERNHPSMLITFASGRRALCKHTVLDLNPAGAATVARDKHAAAYFLRRQGFPTPDEQIVRHRGHRPLAERNDPDGDRRALAAAVGWAGELGFPVAIKPNDASQGKLFVRADDAEQTERAVAAIFARDLDALVQRFHRGFDHRLVILDGELVCAYRRLPLAVTGDGQQTIDELLTARLDEQRGRGRTPWVRLDDERLAGNLRRAGLERTSVPPAGTTIALFDHANLSAGGEAIDLSAVIHPGFVALCAGVARALGLRLCGVDVLADDLTRPPAAGEHVVLEANRSPGLSNFAALGPAQAAVVEAMYRRILRHLEAGT